MDPPFPFLGGFRFLLIFRTWMVGFPDAAVAEPILAAVLAFLHFVVLNLSGAPVTNLAHVSLLPPWGALKAWPLLAAAMPGHSGPSVHHRGAR